MNAEEKHRDLERQIMDHIANGNCRANNPRLPIMIATINGDLILSNVHIEIKQEDWIVPASRYV